MIFRHVSLDGYHSVHEADIWVSLSGRILQSQSDSNWQGRAGPMLQTQLLDFLYTIAILVCTVQRCTESELDTPSQYI